MNIFKVDSDPQIAAQSLCDKHVPKMIVESGQMLSTAHRMLDGIEKKIPSKSGKRMVKGYYHPKLDDVLYKAVHHNHPSTVWTREAADNYSWHYEHFIALCKEFEFRFGKVHETYRKLSQALSKLPENIPSGSTPIRKAMGAYPELLHLDGVTAYRKFYWLDKRDFAQWNKGRPAPQWWIENEKAL